MTDLSQIQKEAGVLAGFRKIGEKDRNADEKHSGVLAHFAERLEKTKQSHKTPSDLNPTQSIT